MTLPVSGGLGAPSHCITTLPVSGGLEASSHCILTLPVSGGLPQPIPLRLSNTGHSPRRGTGHLASLGSLLRMRQEQEEAPRGSLVPRTLLTDPLMVGYQAPGGGSGGYGAVAPYRPPPYAARKEDIPATLYSLGQVGRLVTRGM